jgi:hypothetical protein
MSDQEYQKLEKRIKVLEEKLGTSEKTEKKPRKSSAYNDFMKEYISEQKSKGSTKSHKELFTEGAKAWNARRVP